MKRRTKGRRPDDETANFWQSYSDMMAALLLIFVLIMSLTLLQARQDYEKKIEEQKAQQKIIAEQQKQLNELVGVKLKIIKQLNEEFSDSDLKVSVDPQTGAITFDSSVLFDFNKSAIKSSGRSFLKEFMPKYFDVLMNKENRKYVAEIIIEGHTDTVGSYMNNLSLSQDRAYSVAEFCLDSKNGVVSSKQLSILRKIVTANGRSYSSPIYRSDGSVDMAKSRRVELKFRLKDDEMISEMQKLLED